jgi:hypothetical protein
MTIKNERVVEKIRSLADSLQTDQVSAVEQAVDALSAEVARSTVEQRLAQVRELARTIRQSLPPEVTLDAEDLYDEAGLPQ